MERLIFHTVIISGIIGILWGGVLLIPFIAPLALFLMFSLPGIFIVVYLKKRELAGFLNLQDGCLLGAVAGFVFLATAILIYLPISWILDKLFGSGSNLFSISRTLSLNGYDFLVVIMLIFFSALLSSLFNSFTGLISAFIVEKLSGNSPVSFEEQLDITEREENLF